MTPEGGWISTSTLTALTYTKERKKEKKVSLLFLVLRLDIVLKESGFSAAAPRLCLAMKTTTPHTLSNLFDVQEDCFHLC